MQLKQKIKIYFRALRLERWPRSLAILPGVFAAFVVVPLGWEHLISWQSFLGLILAFFLTWIVSTVNYIINEITDAPYDIHHPTKKERPFVRKEVKEKVLWLIALLLIILSYLLSAVFFTLKFQLALVLLLVAGVLYNVKPVRFKDIPYFDSTVESANNPIRFLIGWHLFCQDFPPVSLLLGWWGFGNFLMIGKRVAEKKFLTAEQSSSYRRSLSRCSLRGLFRFMILNALFMLLMIIIFFRRINFFAGYWLLPLIVVFLGIFIKKSLQDRETAEEPEQLLKNPYFALYSLLLLLLFVFIYFFRR